MFRVLVSIVLLSCVVARADERLDIRLVSSVTKITPGQPFHLGLALHHGPGYHTYWKHPGIVGVPTNIKWSDLPKGITIHAIDWPEPEPVLMFQIKAQGYERDVVLPILIEPAATLKPGSKLKFTGKASWMCCARTCHPGFLDLDIELPVAEPGTAPSLDAKWSKKIESELAIRPSTSTAWQASARTQDKDHILVLKPLTNARPITADEVKSIVFFTEDGLIDSDKPQNAKLNDDGSLTFTLREAEFILGDRPTSLNGVILRKGGWETSSKRTCIRVSPKL